MKEIINNLIIIKIDWSSKSSPLQLRDCDFDSSMNGLDIYAILLDSNKKVISDSDLLFYNSKTINSFKQITSQSQSVICLKGLASSDDLIYDGYDGVFEINFELMDIRIQEIIFFIGRPYSRKSAVNEWINEKLVKKVTNEFVFVDVIAESEKLKNTVKFYYNRVGALSILTIGKWDGKWYFHEDLVPEEHKHGLFEIVNKYVTDPL
jgi:stress response protein SCP2